MSFRIASDDPDRTEMRQGAAVRSRLPVRVGSCGTDRYAIEDGLAVLCTRYAPEVDLVEETRLSHARPVLMLTLGLQGESRLQSGSGMEMHFRAGQITLASFQHNQGERHYRARQPVTQLRLAVDESFLVRYFDPVCRRGLLRGSAPRMITSRPCTPATNSLARAMMENVRSTAGVGRLRLHIQALSLLAGELEAFEPMNREPVLGDEDIVRLERARALMESQLDQPLTVAWIARSVGINEHKLKAGFRQHFNTSPCRLLFELRMFRAKELLEQTRCQVAQAAWRVGYRHPANFSAAFTRFFGRTPKSVAGCRPDSVRRDGDD